MGTEAERLEQARRGEAPWRRWGPYLSERQWGTVREDYSADGNAWEYFPFEHAHRRAYRWGEDGLAGFSDDRQILCLGLALWNGRDPILKERLFGLSGEQGNHGEDVKELYYYLDAAPTHSYQRMLYKYPQRPFPYRRLVEGNRRRGPSRPELELIDTGVFDGDRYFDVYVEYAKASPDDLLLRVTAHNRGTEPAVLHLLPQIWLRNTWTWSEAGYRPRLRRRGSGRVEVEHRDLGRLVWSCESGAELLFCENETDPRVLGSDAAPGRFKDGIQRFVLEGEADAVDAGSGSRCAAHWRRRLEPGAATVVRTRLVAAPEAGRTASAPDAAREAEPARWDGLIDRRRAECDSFYAELQAGISDPDARRVHRQALAGMLWSKQYYAYDVRRWLDGDPGQPEPPAERRAGRNHRWLHLANDDVIAMPDTWEYPWYAGWDQAFHCLPLARVDIDFARRQLLLLLDERYQHPSGQLPGCEWALDEVTPPVQAWAAWELHRMEIRRGGAGDLEFLERVVERLRLDFSWWHDAKAVAGLDLFGGGFLGLDNIGVFDRSARLPGDGRLAQADGSGWMAMYCLDLMRIALELARREPRHQELAAELFGRFLEIAAAINHPAEEGTGCWSEDDGFYYDVLLPPEEEVSAIAEPLPVAVRSLVGLVPLLAVRTFEPELLEGVPDFRAEVERRLASRPDPAGAAPGWLEPGAAGRRMLAAVPRDRLERLLGRMLDPAELLSDHGVRSLSRAHADRPYVFEAAGCRYDLAYLPGESDSATYGRNSNWRGPVWLPVNYLIVEALDRYHDYYGESLAIELPSGSGRRHSLGAVAGELRRRLCGLFLRDARGRRPLYGDDERLQESPHFRDHLLFYEYFHGDSGRGVGAAHQTGWTGLIANLIESVARAREDADE